MKNQQTLACHSVSEKTNKPKFYLKYKKTIYKSFEFKRFNCAWNEVFYTKSMLKKFDSGKYFGGSVVLTILSKQSSLFGQISTGTQVRTVRR